MTDRLEYFPLEVSELEKGSEAFHCPYCQKTLQFRLRVGVQGIYTLNGIEPPEEKHRRAIAAITEEHKRQIEIIKSNYEKKVAEPKEPISVKAGQYSVLEIARATGLFDAFTDVVNVAMKGIVPNDLEAFFVKVMEKAERDLIPQWAVLQLKEEFQTNRVDFFSFLHIGFVVADGKIRRFIPVSFVKGAKLKTKKVKAGAIKMDPSPQALNEWKRTRFGYVAGGGAFYDALNVKSIGDFAKASS